MIKQKTLFFFKKKTARTKNVTNTPPGKCERPSYPIYGRILEETNFSSHQVFTPVHRCALDIW